METGQQNISKLRFPEFNTPITVTPMQQALSELIDCEHKTAPYVEDSIYKVVRTNNVKNGSLVEKELMSTTRKAYLEWTKRGVPEVGDIMFTREAPAGESTIVPKDLKVCLGQRMVLLKPNKKISSGNYLSQYLQCSVAKKSIYSYTIGSTVTRINIADIYNIDTLLPSLPEQQKIASFLSAVDTKIEQLTHKRQLLEQYKKGVMQQIFSQQIRFKKVDGSDYSDWEEKKLGEVFKSNKGKGISKEKISANGKHQCVLYGELYTKYKEVICDVVSKTNDDDGLKSKIGDLLMPASTTTTGIDLANITAINKEDVRLGGDIIVLRGALDKINNVFFAYYLSHHKKHQIASRAQGITIVHIYYNSIKDLDLDLPCPAEQTQIANFLSTIDKKIDLVNTQLENTQAFKKGLLQQMFV